MAKRTGKRELITDADFDSKLLNSLTHGSVLGFKQADGSIQHWRVCRMNRKARKWWVEPWTLYDMADLDKLQADRRQEMSNNFDKDLTELVGEDQSGPVKDLLKQHAFFQIPTALGRKTTIRTTDNDQPDLLTYEEWEELHDQNESDPGPVPDAPAGEVVPETDTVRDPSAK